MRLSLFHNILSFIQSLLFDQNWIWRFLCNFHSTSIVKTLIFIFGGLKFCIEFAHTMMTQPTETTTHNPMSESIAISCVLSWVMLVFCVFGVVGNIVSIYIFRHRTMRSAINILLTGLSVIDLAMVILVVPAFVLVGLSDCHPDLKEIFPYVICFAYPLTLIAQSCSTWTFLLITFERYIAVCRPLQAQRFCSVGNSRKGLLIVCALAVVYNLPRFFEYRFFFDEKGLFSYVEYLREDSCYKLIYYTILFLITHFLIPFSTLAFTNTRIVKEIYNAVQERTRLGRRETREQKTTIMMAIIIFIFLFCNVLLFILNIIQAWEPKFFTDDQTKNLAYVLNDLSNLLIVINSSTNSFIYYLFSERYRRLFKHLLRIKTLPLSATTSVATRGDSCISRKKESPHVRTALMFRSEQES